MGTHILVPSWLVVGNCSLQILGMLAFGTGLIRWARRGAVFPRWVHRLAIALGIAGVLSILILAMVGTPSAGVVAACLLMPPAASYVGWLWLGGPCLGSEVDSV